MEKYGINDWNGKQLEFFVQKYGLQNFGKWQYNTEYESMLLDSNKELILSVENIHVSHNNICCKYFGCGSHHLKGQ